MNEFQHSKDQKDLLKQRICNFEYMSEMVKGKNQLMKEMLNVFLKQVPDQLQGINDAVSKADYAAIAHYANIMKTSVSIMDISIITPVLQEMETLGGQAANILKIQELNQKLLLIVKQAIKEVEKKKQDIS